MTEKKPELSHPWRQQFRPKNKPEKTILSKNEHGFYDPVTKKIDLSQK